MIGIYKITNLINQKIYIGQSINIEQRWKEHRKTMNSKKCKHLPFTVEKTESQRHFEWPKACLTFPRHLRHRLQLSY